MWRLCLLLLSGPAMADALVATRMIKAQSLIGPEDVTLVEAEIPGALTDPAAAAGMETRVAIYPGRPVLAADLDPPALVERNQVVALVYRNGALTIHAEGRALARARAGEALRVMNIGSRATVTGRVAVDGRVTVGPETTGGMP